MNTPPICIIPAYNAAGTVAQVITAVRREVPGIVVLGVDDGSTDDTRRILRRQCDRMIEFDQNRGKGAALRAAFLQVANEPDSPNVLTMDADGQHDAAFAPRLLETLSRADLVIGSRHINTRTVPAHRRLANLVSSAAARIATRLPISDSQSGYRAIRLPVIQQIAPLARGNRYEFETDFLVLASHAGYTITEVPVPTIYGPPSHFRKLADAWLVARVLWSYKRALLRNPRSGASSLYRLHSSSPHENSLQ